MAAGKRLQHSPEELAILFGAVESTNEGFVTIDEHHNVVFFNSAAEKIFGYRRKEVLGKDLSTILAPQCSEDHSKAVNRYLRSKTRRIKGHARELVATRKNGETFPCLISFSVARVEGRIFFTGIVRDMTETHRLREQVTRAEHFAEIGRMVAEISHEIKNPLMIIGGFVRRLLKSTQDAASRPKLAIIASEVQRLENLLAELRDLYNPQRFRMRPFDMNALLNEVFILVKQATRSTEAQVSLRTATNSLQVRGNKEKLKQVFLNLSKNAMEALNGCGVLTIRSRLNGDRVEVCIEDNGCGIPEHARARVFDPFFTTKKGGTGLGLAICRRILDDHEDATFQLTNRRGGGTRARVLLPVHIPKKSATAPSSHKKKKG